VNGINGDLWERTEEGELKKEREEEEKTERGRE
jgi:hypothetical protein